MREGSVPGSVYRPVLLAWLSSITICVCGSVCRLRPSSLFSWMGGVAV